MPTPCCDICVDLFHDVGCATQAEAVDHGRSAILGQCGATLRIGDEHFELASQSLRSGSTVAFAPESLPEECVIGLWGEREREAARALNDQWVSDRHCPQCGAPHPHDNVGGGIRWPRIGHTACQRNRGPPDPLVDAGRSGLEVQARCAVADDDEPDRMRRRESFRRVDHVNEGIELQLDRQSRDGDDQQFVVGHRVVYAKGLPIYVGMVGVDVDWRFEHPDVSPTQPRLCAKLFGTHDERNRRRYERRDLHREHCADQRHTEQQMCSEVGVEARWPFIAVDDVDLTCASDRRELGYAGWSRSIAQFSGSQKRKPLTFDVVDQRALDAVHSDVVSVLSMKSSEVDRVDLAAANVEIVRIYKDPHEIDTSLVRTLQRILLPNFPDKSRFVNGVRVYERRARAQACRVHFGSSQDSHEQRCSWRAVKGQRLAKGKIGKASWSTKLALVTALVGATLPFAPQALVAPAVAADLCGPGSNPIVCENSKPGTPPSIWDINNNGDPSIQGFATDMSVEVGGTIDFKIDTTASSYRIEIYRMGWYGGNGARLVATIDPSATLPRNQPACITQSETNLIDCGNWQVSASWNVPADAVSGVYIAAPTRSDDNGSSHIIFVVRDSTSTSDLLFQTSDPTWQAYNDYGGTSTYFGPNGRATKVSYNRPISTRGGTPDGRDSFFGSEYAMLRWLERNGYDVSYISGVDTDRMNPNLLLNHNVFMSVGHDEYWSGQQRTNVEAARDAGVNLAFFSGNEVYWKTRWEPSVDGSNTSYRTLVVYKETLDAAKTDPSPEWTGTWRDPRFSPPSDGGRPENALTGTLFTVNCCTYSMKVPAKYGNLRFWRNTSVATLGAGGEAVFPFGTLGYEWDEDIDNGFRPPGAFRMSETTEIVDQRLMDYGKTVAVAEATHYLMMHRAASGALVFGAGTVQWSWGLDVYHDGTAAPTNAAMQQATVNVFADMGVQPATLQSGISIATASTDVTPPTTAISSPIVGQTFTHGDVITVAGTASDAGGGVVAGVEVSMDGGATWRRADGRDTWTYTSSVNTLGTQQVMARAVDDSSNLGSATTVGVEVSCPCQIFGDASIPEVQSFSSTTPIELGVRFQSDVAGWITGVRFFKGPTNSGTHAGSLWDNTGTLLATGTFANETATGWQELIFAEPVPIIANTTYVASYFAPNGGYSGDTNWFALAPTVSPPLRALQDVSGNPNGIYAVSSSSQFPTSTFGASNYWVDALFSDTQPPDTRPPAAVSTSPIAGSSSVNVGSPVAVAFDEPLDPATVAFSVTDAAAVPVTGSVSYDGPTNTVTFSPAAPLAVATTYSVSLSVSDVAGNPLAAPLQFSFTTALAGGSVAALWDDSVVPGTVDSGDIFSIETGVKFTASKDLDVTGVRFYKSVANTGTHVGSLWDSSGSLLAQATFGTESTTGWQEVAFAVPVRILAGQTYTVSYLAPNGRYSADAGYLNSAYSSGPLTALASGASGGNGVYAYGVTSTFPTSSYNKANYWVTPVYAVPPDISPPALAATSPVAGASSVAANSVVSATFDEPIDPASLVVSVTDAGGGPVTGVVVYDDPTTTATFTPDTSLANATQYTVAVSATDVIGNATPSPLQFSFTTALPDGSVAGLWDDTVVPGTVDSGDGSSIEIGVKFSANQDLDVTGVRFYKSVANTGIHVGSLWDSAGTLLAQVTFGGESSAGWQEATFSAPVRILAGQTYVVSYLAPNGGYSVTGGYFGAAYSAGPLTAPASGPSGGNGVYRYSATTTFPTSSYNSTNYWVTPVYVVPPDITPPALAATSPANGASSVVVGSTVSATFDEPVQSATASLVLRDGGGAAVAGSVSYDAASNTVTFTPAAPLAASSTYTADVSASDLAGNAPPSPLQFSFTTALPDGSVAGLWDDTVVPGTVDSGDGSSIEIGVKFSANQDLDVTGVRFYKSVANTGIHVGSLWDSAGTLLAQVTFGGESSAGWQEATFSAPVRILAGQTYVVSYLAPNGGYSYNSGYFNADYTSGPLTAPATSTSGGNAVYSYNAGAVFPSSSGQGANYWVTPVYQVP